MRCELFNFRVKELGGSCVLDLGVYVLQFQQFVFRGSKPVKFVTSGHLNEYQTDESFAAIITYEGGKIADVAASARLPLTNEAIVVGTKGVIRVNYPQNNSKNSFNQFFLDSLFLESNIFGDSRKSV